MYVKFNEKKRKLKKNYSEYGFTAIHFNGEIES